MPPSTPQTEPQQSLIELLRERRSIFQFREDAVPKESLIAAIDHARWAPNHHLTEPWQFYILGPETAGRLAELAGELATAAKGPEKGQQKREKMAAVPQWVVVTVTRTANDAFRQQEDYAAVCCAIQNFMLYLWQDGIGTKWSTGEVTQTIRFYDLCGIDHELEEIAGLFSCGYPADVPKSVRRRSVDDITTELP